MPLAGSPGTCSTTPGRLRIAAGADVWVLTNANGLGGTPVWTQLAPTGSPPISNGEAATAYDPVTNHLIVYGGCTVGCSPALADLFVLTNANGLGAPSFR